jgi:hypothetical protein
MDFSSLKAANVLPPNKKVQKSYQRANEPGIKVPTANYKQVAQICDRCEDIVTHFYSYEKQKMMCSYCGLISGLPVSAEQILATIIKPPVNKNYFWLNLFFK